MTVITVKRTIIRRAHVQPSETRRTFRELARPYFAGERTIKFAIKLLLFAMIVAISAFAAAGALAKFLHQAAV
jgi:hypothetical protein